MFAIIKTGGKQYRVAANDIIKIEKLVGASGDLIEFTDVLMMGQGESVKIGAPLVANAKVYGTVLSQIRDDKILIFKKKRRHNYRRKNGHRQYLTVVQITDILADGEKVASVKAKAEKSIKKEVSKQNLTPELKAEPKILEKKAASKPKVKKSSKEEEI